MKTKAKKKRNKPDATIRNVSAARKREAKIEKRLKALEVRVGKLEGRK